MQHNNPLVSINIITYNSQKYIRDCFGSVLNQTYPNIEVLIIDNASTDDIREYLKKFSSISKLKIIFNDKNTGFTAGHNQGIRNSKGDFILCLNHDVVIDKDFVKKAVKILKDDNQVAAVQGKLLRWNTGNPVSNNFKDYDVSRIIDTTGLVVFKNRRIVNRGQGHIDENQFKKIEEIFGADGAAPVYRREALEDIKINKEYFDEDFFCYKEDVDLAWQVRLLGYEIDFCENAVATHKIGQSLPGLPPSKFYNIVKNRIYVCLKNYSQNRIIKRIMKIIFLISLDSIYYSYKMKSLAYFFAGFKAVTWNIANIGKLKNERKKIQKIRKISDEEIEKVMIKKSIEFMK